MEYRTSSTVYKKYSNARSFNDRSTYDGVFAAPSKHGAPVFSARVEDYREIFGGSRVSSIPILDVPAVSDKKFPVDVRSSKVEYSKIFGGFDELNFAVPYEELLAEANKANSFSKETRTSAGRGSAATENSSQYEKEHNFSTREASSLPFDRMEKFSVSYQKINQGSKSYATETAHVALPQAIPGFSRLIDEQSPVQMCVTDMPTSTSEKLKDIHPEKVGNEVENKPELPISGDSEQTFRSTNPTNRQNRTGWFRSDSADKLFNGYEVDQGVHKPETPLKHNFLPKFGRSDGFSGKTTGLNSETFEHSKDSYDVSSPPYFGEEVEVNPVAAASVAALRKAIDAAQESIKVAKESMERKKAARLQKHKKTRSSRILNPEERKEVSTRQEKVAGKTNGKMDPSEEEIVDSREDKSSAECHITQRAVRENLNAIEPNYVELKSTKVDCREEEAKELDATEQFYEPRHFDKDEAKRLEPRKEDNANRYGWQGNIGLKETSENPGEYGDNLVIVDKTKEPEENGINLSVVKGILMSKLKSVLGVIGKEEDKITRRQDQVETEMKAEASVEHEKCVELPEELQITEDHEEFSIREMGVNKDRETQVKAHQWVVEKDRHICQQEEKEGETNAFQIENDVEKIFDKSNEEEGFINCNNVFHDGEEAQDMLEDVESKGKEELQENKRDDEMIEGLPFHLRNNEIGHHVQRQINIGECAVHENIVVQATPDNLNTENKIELEDGLSKQDECDNLSEDQDANNFIASMEGVEVITDQPEYRNIDNSMELANIALEVMNNEPEAITEEGDVEDRLPFKLFSMAEDALKRRFKMENSNASPISIQSGLDFGLIDLKLEQMQHDASVNWSSIFCSLENAEGMASELGGIERNMEKIEVSIIEENDDDSNEEEIPSNVNNTEAGNQPSITIDGNKISEEVVEENANTGATENHQATIEVEESETFYVLKNEMQLEFDENNIRTSSLSGMIDMDSETVHDIKTSETRGESEDSYRVIMTEDEMEASDSSDKEVEYAVHLETSEEADSPGSSGRKENLENTEQEISTGQKVTENENHRTTPTLGEIEINADMQREAGIETKFDNETEAHGLPQPKEELAENSTDQSILENDGENHQAPQLMQEEKVFHEKFEKDAEVIKDRLRKIDEAKGKERERERLAVERAIREARERAFAEARERAAAERASADTRRRVMAEPRERPRKASIEANTKPSTEKHSKEAKLKAQRAAVEMATAEARERALEKAMSEKAISEARNLADKIVAEKLNGAAGVSKVKKSFSFNDSQPKGQCSSSNFRHANSFNLGGPDASEREVGSAGESAQRSKARLERHQRTVERVANALAEKNIRDILGQREQEERNRLAEGLDAEVKRWSSGKEGNLRALLSTLQYILGPDSGWQPVPLTDIITTAAVKKAYRRATLSVHPDKLQQRGASIPQKYLCEKVFDLLKAAWNKFNMEERL
ncbi:auxilin-like protein 1 [Cucurbita moschata]|uniref:Auxilin-like protein 1 n=1 Tax=Cucurbita moschata TaxID=3662 RepID=A0A6J1FRL0_CUCMO|nr:auxilin-like protein 1 [Cucurbita moschata]